MLQAFIITLREGLEAFLIVAVSVTYLRKTGVRQLITAVRWGTAVGLAVSALGGYLLLQASNQEALGGPLALIAAVSVAGLITHMWRVGGHMKANIEHRLQSSAVRAGRVASLGVFLFTLLMITREGMETALLLLQLRETMNLLAGALLGLGGAAGVAWLWVQYGRRVNLSLVFQVTAIFLLVFVVQLVIAGIHETAEAHYLPYSEAIHAATESWGPDSGFGHLLTYMTAVLPLGWLALTAAFGTRPVFTTTARAPEASGAVSQPCTNPHV